jgi:rfaE bifunctional protein kinase chain/domain
MNKENTHHLHDFSRVHVLVIGDVMIDQYLHGVIERISPEAPVPVVMQQSLENRLGGAANVALNFKAMGAKVSLVGMTGDDEEALILRHLLEESGIDSECLLSFPKRTTTVKTRIMAQGQHVLRIDREQISYISQSELESVKAVVANLMETKAPDVIILQDYNKGFLHPVLIQRVIEMATATNIPTVVDPKKWHFEAYKGCTVIKPNRKEISEFLGKNINSLGDLVEAHQALAKILQHSVSFITLGKDGIFVAEGNRAEIVPAKLRQIVDVCGAGDTVLCILALYLVKKMSFNVIAILANAAGAQVCSKPGVASLNKEAFFQEIEAELTHF